MLKLSHLEAYLFLPFVRLTVLLIMLLYFEAFPVIPFISKSISVETVIRSNSSLHAEEETRHQCNFDNFFMETHFFSAFGLGGGGHFCYPQGN